MQPDCSNMLRHTQENECTLKSFHSTVSTVPVVLMYTYFFLEGGVVAKVAKDGSTCIELQVLSGAVAFTIVPLMHTIIVWLGRKRRQVRRT